ncbi:G8 domain-containing protein, partial [Verrucomicrobiales bacterium]|nr:G8 domain-containing protein [Verrucomicrobiales bacterium]
MKYSIFLLGFSLFVQGLTGAEAIGTVTETSVELPSDTVPRFANIPDVGLAAVKNLGSGNFSDPTIWPGGVVPGTDARVQIIGDTVVTYDLVSDARLDCIEVQDGGQFAFATDRSTRLMINELMVLPGGELTIGTEVTPVAPAETAEIIFRADAPLKTGTLESPGIDPGQYGRGLLVVGKVRIHGRPMEQTYFRFAEEPLAGASTLLLEQAPIGWRVGDRLLIPDTRQHPFRKNQTFTSQAEEVMIASIEGETVTLESPLSYDHRGPRDVEGNVGEIELSMLPHVGNLSRNVVIRSEVAAPVLDRGHVICFGRADVDIRYAAFRDLGRTTIESLDSTTFDENGNLTNIGANQIGRYSIHLHHLWGPLNTDNTGYQFSLVGNVIQGMEKWGVTIHNAHYGLFQWNVAYDGKGSIIATEDGNEAFNVFERNFVVHTRAGDTRPILGHGVARGGVFSGRALFGTTRDAFWFSGEHNYVRDNVAANAPDFAYNYNGYYLSRTMRIPRFRGADMRDPDSYEGWNYRGPGAAFLPGRDRREGLPVLESARNEAYSSGQGLWLTWARGCCSVSFYKQESLFEDYRIWHMDNSGVFAYHESRNTFQGFIMRNDPAVSMMNGSGTARVNRGFWFGSSSYENGQLTVRDFDVQGFNIGIVLPPKPEDGTDEANVTLIENGVLKNHINVVELYAALSDGKATEIRDVRFTPVRIYASNGLPTEPLNILMSPSRNQQMSPMRPSRTTVYNFGGEVGRSFDVYWEEQAPDFMVPSAFRPDLHAGNPSVTCPEEGLTNWQCLQQYGVATASGIAPCMEIDGDDCTAARARAVELGISGLVFPISASVATSYQAWREEVFTSDDLGDL